METMNFKASLGVLAVCLFMCSAAFAAPKTLVIPEETEYIPVSADLKTSGPQLIFSDSPEVVFDKGILYRDTVTGSIRIFLHHVNGFDSDKKLAVIVRNTDQLHPVDYKISRQGVGYKTFHYLLDGKEAELKYFTNAEPEKFGYLGFGRSIELLSGRGIVLAPSQLLTGIMDLFLAAPAEVTVLMCEPRTDLEIFSKAASVLPMDDHPLRGTFPASDWEYSLNKPLSVGKTPLMLKLADAESGFALGKDATTGLAAENYGNYGIVYQVNFQVAGDEPVRFIFNPIGGRFAGYALLENKTEQKFQLLALPEEQVFFGDTIEEALELAVLAPGEYSFTWSPPGSSNLPVRLWWQRVKA